MKNLFIYFLFFLLYAFLININAQWTNPSVNLTGRAIQCFTVSNLAVVAGTDGGLVQSTNNGLNWTNIGSGLPYTNIRTLLNIGTSHPYNLLAGMVSGRISMSSNFGIDWNAFPDVTEQLPFLANVNCILERSNSSNYLVGTDRGVYLLPQYYPLSSWIAINNGLPSAETKVRAIVENNGEIFIGTNSGIFELNGFDWIDKSSGILNTNITSLVSIDTVLIAGTSQGSIGGIYISTDNGNNWSLSLTETWVTSILVLGSNLFVGSFGNGIWRSTNYGVSWSQINDGLASGAYYVLSLGKDDLYLYAGTNGSAIWRRPLSQIVTSINEQSNILLPTKLILDQNYPNPFNPSTKIRFTVPVVDANFTSSTKVQLKIYDVLGNEVATMVDGIKAAGNYEVEFNPASSIKNPASGIYFYQLRVGEITSTKKMQLIK